VVEAQYCYTRYIKVQAKLAGKPAHELEFVYNVAAGLQLLQNRVLRREEEVEDAGGVPSAFDVNTRVGLHQLYTFVPARYEVITLATQDSPASENLRTLGFGQGDQDAYCPTWDYLATAQNASLVK